MKFTAHQEDMLGLYLRESGNTVKNLPPPAQIHSLKQARRRLYDELVNLRCETVEDADLSSLLERLRVSPSGWQKPPGLWEVRSAASSERTGAPGGQGLQILGESQAIGRERPAQVERAPQLDRHRLLGVCTALSERLAFPVLHVRAAFLVAGVLTGPFALLLYLGIYFEAYISEGRADKQRIALFQLAKTNGKIVGLLALLYAGTEGLLVLGNALYSGLASSPFGVGVWGRFADYNTPLFLGALLALVPVATLGALPLPERARTVINQVMSYGIAMYAIALCLGIASYLTGILLGISSNFNG